ncbi:flagellar hook-associated protein FlgK [Anaerocolumna xylanovorans]|uniref:Flagellar hook-associated protein 1 n=1 Tax=Anaerocolumna xylanovorans DSM 12503 TaxID=1121345 RepID=A0A1M7Y889_9FIRM|nr:flagellar hook-associated protein FlgK [Anaerocolumna xylanovorans]SHO48738.1 flagellar hook-associated protein 1 FlgK [Anaerocolumna xylanovorans DSM 12503]
MPSTFFGLNIGTSGLYTYQAAINTTAHNISNTETEGYTRQILNQKAANAIRVNGSYGMVGAGATATEITQARDAYYDLKYRSSNTTYGEYQAKEYYMTEIENYFNEVSVAGFTTSYNSLFTSLQELSKNPSSATTRTQLVNYAKNLTEYFNGMANSLTGIQQECNFEVKTQVDRINSLGQQVAEVTKQINTLEAGGGTANDLRDQRGLLIDELSGIVNVSVDENVVGQNVGVTSYVVKIEGQVLVNTGEYNTLKVVPRTEKVNQSDADGLYEIQWNNGNNFAFQNSISQGYLSALLQVRDGNNQETLKGTVQSVSTDKKTVTLGQSSINDIEKLNIPSEGYITIDNQQCKYNSFEVTKNAVTQQLEYTFHLDKATNASPGSTAAIGESIDYKGIPYYMSQLNELVRTFSENFNAIHKTGYDLKNNMGVNFFTGVSPATGDDYNLDTIGYYNLTAGNFSVAADVFKNPSMIATSGKEITNGVEDKTVVDKLIALKDKAGMFKQGTPSSFFQTMVAEVGIDSKKATNNAKNQKDILGVISNQRLSVSGVDVDEEAMNLVMYQKAYNLSAKVISVMNEIYDKLINGTGV